jgi:hypothetical protein
MAERENKPLQAFFVKKLLLLIKLEP